MDKMLRELADVDAHHAVHMRCRGHVGRAGRRRTTEHRHRGGSNGPVRAGHEEGNLDQQTEYNWTDVFHSSLASSAVTSVGTKGR